MSLCLNSFICVPRPIHVYGVHHNKKGYVPLIVFWSGALCKWSFAIHARWSQVNIVEVVQGKVAAKEVQKEISYVLQ